MSKKKYSYLREGRLADIIRLIAVLGKQSKFSFRTNDGITKELNGTPKSAKTWTSLAEDHPEFFKLNKENLTIVLLLRFLNKEEDAEGTYDALTIDQTQKLIDQAITLHDKQIARYQRNNFKIPLWAAIITALVTVTATSITFLSSKSNNKEILNKLDDLNGHIQGIEIKQSNNIIDTVKAK